MTPDNIKYGHTPTGPEVIAGVTLKDAKRGSATWHSPALFRSARISSGT